MGRMGDMVGCYRKWGEDGNEAEETGATMEEKGKENSLKGLVVYQLSKR